MFVLPFRQMADKQVDVSLNANSRTQTYADDADSDWDLSCYWPGIRMHLLACDSQSGSAGCYVPASPPRVNPSMNRRCRAKKKTRTGVIIITAAALLSAQSVPGRRRGRGAYSRADAGYALSPPWVNPSMN